MYVHAPSVADDWELINPPPIDQMRGTVGDSPRAGPRILWKSAIEQQILLNQMNKQNQNVESKSVSGWEEGCTLTYLSV